MIRSVIAAVLVVSVGSAAAAPGASIRASTRAVVRAVDSTHVLDLHVNVSNATFAVVRTSARPGELASRDSTKLLRSPVSIDVGDGLGSVTISASEPIVLTTDGLTLEGNVVHLVRESVGGPLRGTASVGRVGP